MKKILLTLSALAASFLFLWGNADAALDRAWTVYNTPQMFLGKSINSTTTDIELAALTRNGTTVSFPVLSGGTLRLRNGSRVEDVSFTGATVNSSSVVTLMGVVRDICWNEANTLTTCSNGLPFPRGAIVELNVDARLLNFKADKNRVNTFTGSGQITGTSTSQAILDLPCVTTAQRDAFTYVTSAGEIICNSTTGTLQQRLGGSWVDIGTSATANATESTSGKTQLATLAQQASGSTLDATTSAPLVLQAKNTTMSGGTVHAGKTVVLPSSGTIPVGMGGTGSGFTMTQSGVLIVSSGGIIRPVTTTTANHILTFDGQNWTTSAISALGVATKISAVTATAGGYGASSTAEFNFGTGTIVANDAEAGDVYCGRASYSYTIGAGNLLLLVELNDQAIGGGFAMTFAADPVAVLEFCGTVRTGGATGTMVFEGSAQSDTTNEMDLETETSIDFTSAVEINIDGQFDTSNGSNTVTLESFVFYKMD